MQDLTAHREEVEPPHQFQAAFTAHHRRYRALLEDARDELRALAVPEVVREHYLSAVVSRPQPAFMLLPIMYLALADAAGGITERHRAYLPWQMLTMELIALYDDTVDHTPSRSNRPTYPHRHGAASAAALSGFLYSTLVDRTLLVLPAALPLLTRLFENLCALEVWEHAARYPAISVASFEAWTRHRCDAVAPVNAYALDSALVVHGAPRLAPEVHVRFGDLQQDVDDLVNVAEARESNDENDDLKLGIVSHPLLATLRADPSVAEPLAELWRPAREVANPERRGAAVAANPRANSLHREIIERMKVHGAPATIDKMIVDARASVAAAPLELRACLHDFNFSFLDRHRRLDPRARFEAHARPTEYGRRRQG
jgi:hypothetical protein